MLKNVFGERQLDSSLIEHEQMGVSFEYGKETAGSVACGGFLTS